MTKPWKRWGPHKTGPQVPTLASLDAYARWAEAYPPTAHNALMRAEETAVKALLPDLRGRTVLDLACGTGRWGLAVQDLGARSVLGFDNSPDMLARCALPTSALAEFAALPLPAQSIDTVICGLALGHVADIRPAFREIRRVLVPGGVVVISDVHPFIVLSGAQRTFADAQGKTWAVEHTVHTISEYWNTGTAAGLTLTGIEEAPLRPDDAIGAPQPGVPVVLVLRFERQA
ncbi:MAG: methyltransferase domain-containing protein [Anaerolineae bacterium]